MTRRLAPLLCFALLALPAHAAGLGDADANLPKRLIEVSLSREIPATDPQIDKVRGQLLHLATSTGETEQDLAHACMRNARYLYDVTRIRVGPLEVLEVLVNHAPSGKPVSETTQRYVDLRVKQKLDHAGALAAFR